ncbi:hypothetical protein MBRA_00646 [Methylobacterium brachiatum]|jgi:hypothetical protein|uniref:DUF2066 domain-containing protein n=1 Tax=Methylobacterium brachiatum TaxID=269660 RepID=A0AAJ1TLK0_9HYPH|nr:hypothetical protein [Methylobacterium brachiatum]MCB4804125.1 hypothetical protein [Methylobacterium brachiatum]MDQ0542936.1 hypothetical protein [Methylobacterium brachiatum]CAA2154969.1 hypothetical protein MBRA_00646 [Methylobacterium brachiatum]
MLVRNLTLRLGRVLSLAVLMAGLGSAASAADPVYPPGSRFGFEPPADMALSRRFSGFERKEGGATLSVVELPPNAFAELVSGFTDANLLSQGFAVEKREEVKVGDNEGMLYTGEQPADPNATAPAIRKWILVVGTPTVTGLIIAQALPDAETEETMRKLVTGVTLRPPLTLDQQVEALPFRIGNMAGFRPIRVLAGNSVLLTAGPKDQMQNLEQPILVLAQAVQQPPAAEQRDGFARAALASNQTMKDFVIERAQSYRSNGVDWHEIVARAVDMPTNVPVVVSQTIRFNPDGYLRALGVVREDQRTGVLAKFREVVDSVQVK